MEELNLQNSNSDAAAADEVAKEVPQSSTDEIADLQPSGRLLPNKRAGLIIVGLLLLVTGGIFGLQSMAAKPEKSDRRGGRGQMQETPVMVAEVVQKTVPIQLQAVGNVQASSTVSVTPQASGRITGVFFKKGQAVRKGDLLFAIDDRTQLAAIQQARAMLAKDQALVQQARATLAKDQGLVEQARATLARDRGVVRQAQATLAKDEAQLQFAQAQSNRYNQLYSKGAISQDQVQQYAVNARVSEATLQADREAIANAQAVVRSDEVAIENAQAVVRGDLAAIENAQAVISADSAALKNAEVQLSYTKIYAPIDGRAGNILVTEGNVVQANSNNPLVTIAKVRPIQVAFSVPEANLPDLQKHAQNGKLKVEVTVAGNSDKPITGVLSFVNNTVDNATGAIQLMGDFDNFDERLFPGQYVNATLTLTEEPNATVVPAQAVQNGPKGQFVFVVKPDMTVENVPVKASSTVDNLYIVQSGVQPGDRIVTDGQANLVSGSKVRIKTEGDRSNSDNQSTEEAQPKQNRRRTSKSAGEQP